MGTYAERLAPMRAQLGIPSPKSVKQAPAARPGQFDRWAAQGQRDMLLPGDVCKAHDWKGMVPVARFNDEPFARTLVEVGVFGEPSKVSLMTAMPGDKPMPAAMAAKIAERVAWMEKWTADAVEAVGIKRIPREPSLLEPSCVYRGDPMADVACKSCRGSVKVKVYHCAIFGKCNLGNHAGDGGKSCRSCNSREMGTGETQIIPFESFNNRYAGQDGWIIGRGPTRFNPEDLAKVTGPVWFINDAVDWERYVTHPETFFLALEWPKFAAYAWRVRSIALMGFLHQHPANGIKRLIQFTHQHRRSKDDYNPVGPLWHLLDQTRDQLAQSRKLYQHGSTMLPAIHFAWFCGVSKLNLVGCDCLPTTTRDGRPATSKNPAECYNPTLPAATDDHGGVSGGIHPTLRKRHDETMRRLGMRVEYLGTPSL